MGCDNVTIKISDLTSLEVLGLQVCAYRLFGSKWEAEILTRLLSEEGNPVKAVALTEDGTGKVFKIGSVRIGICRLREYLSDIGLDNIIRTKIGGGYYIKPNDASRLIKRLMDEA